MKPETKRVGPIAHWRKRHEENRAAKERPVGLHPKMEWVKDGHTWIHKEAQNG